MVVAHEGERLKAWRQAKDLTQQEVARKLGTDRSTIRRIEQTGRGYHLRRYAELVNDAANAESRQINLSSDAAPESLYHRLLNLLSQPDIALHGTTTPMSNEERILLSMVEEHNLTPAQRFKLLSAIFGLLAERLERTTDATEKLR